jgi:hypothetical protein
MKITRLILVFAAALSLGLAVFANVRTHGSVTASTQSTVNSDVSLFDGDAAADGIKVAGTGCVFTGQAPAGLQVAQSGMCLTSPGQAPAGLQVAQSGMCLTSPGQGFKDILA